MNGLEDYEELFVLLNREKVKYLIVGAYAVGYHAQPRATGDIDIFVESSKRNASRLLTVIEKFGYKNVGIRTTDFETPGIIVQLGYPPFRVDFITEMDGVEFRNAWKHRVRAKFGHQQGYYISKRDLIKNKQASGRARDAFDLELLGYRKRKKKQ
jgi:c-di-GMP-related signal transduction protein